jgi:putative phosphonate metabolism protein
MSERFAIYYAPPATGALWERASTWLGRDAASGDIFDGPVAGIDRSRLLNLTQSANRYGFHATMKPPMALADGASRGALEEAVADFCQRHQPVELGQMQLAFISGFLALIPKQASEALTDLAAHVVEDFDPFRAPMTIKDRAARMSKGLSPRQEELLDGYGYPYVFEQFKFHMTLTDRMAEGERDEIIAAAATWFGPLLEQPLVLDTLCLFHEAERGHPFTRIADFALGQER